MGILGGEDADVKLVRGWRCCTARYCCIGDGVLLVIVTFLGVRMDAVMSFLQLQNMLSSLVSSLQSASLTAVPLFSLVVLSAVKSAEFCDMSLLLDPLMESVASTASAFEVPLFQDVPSLFGSSIYSVPVIATEWSQGALSASDMQIFFLLVVAVIDRVMHRCSATALLTLSVGMVNGGLQVQAVVFSALCLFAFLVSAALICFSCNGCPSMSRLRSHSAVSRISAISDKFEVICLRRVDDSLVKNLSGRE